MIKNEREYKITKASLKKLEHAVAHIQILRQEGKQDVAKLKVQELATKSMCADLRDQISDYDKLKKGKFSAGALNLVESLPANLIRARIALGWTQKDLAARLGTSEQQIQKYEATDYESASFKKIVEIAALLRVAQSHMRRKA